MSEVSVEVGDVGRAPTEHDGSQRGLEALRRQKRRDSSVTRLIQAMIVLISLGLWQVLSGPVIDPFWFSQPSSIASRVWEWSASGFIWPHLYVTLKEVAYGFALGGIAGATTGILVGRTRLFARAAEPLIMAAFAVPTLALAPLIILVFGIGIASKVVIVAMTVFFLMFFNAYGGIRDVDEDLIDAVTMMGASKTYIFRRVMMPATTAWIIAGLRLCVRYSLAAAVVGELIAASAGIGWLAKYSSGRFDVTGFFAAIIWILITAVALNGLLTKIERHLLRWR